MAAVQTREATELTLSEVLQRLGKLGIKPSSVRALGLPDWWDPALETDPMVVLEGAGYIAKRFGLDPLSVLTPGADIVLKGQLAPKFKTRVAANLEEVQVIQGIACRIAEAVASCTPFPYQGLPSNAQEIRQRILSNKPWVDLESLIGFCWSQGIPVVYLPALPPEFRKIDGLAVNINDRPVIVLASQKKFSAWILFILAHELGHILLGHVTDVPLIDEKVNTPWDDHEEQAANQFATDLILGEAQHLNWPKRLYFPVLQQSALELAATYQADPGAICFNYAWQRRQNSDWAAATAAVKAIQGNIDEPHPFQLVNQVLKKYLDLTHLDTDTQAYLKLLAFGG